MSYLKGIVHDTPLMTASSIDRLVNKHVYFKMENYQKTGAFKIRGAVFKIASLSNTEAQKGVIAASAGNHAQGVALAAAKRGIPAKIYMPEKTPAPKVEATKGYGAAVVLTGESFQEALQEAEADQKQNGSIFIHPFDDPDIMAGQGTIAVEMLNRQPKLDTILVPIGGGGLISGVAFAAKQIKPSIRIIGIQAENACATFNAYHKLNKGPLTSVSTIAEGIAVKKPGILTFPMIQQYVDDVLTVSEQDIAAAILYVLQRHKTLTEGAGAAAFAALLKHGHLIPSSYCGVIVSGGNLDILQLPFVQSIAGSRSVTNTV